MQTDQPAIEAAPRHHAVARRDSGACPHCGGRLDVEVGVVAGRFAYSRSDGLRLDGSIWPAGKQTGDLIGLVMLARGRVVGSEELAAGLNSASERSRDLVKAQMHVARREIVRLGLEWPLSQKRGLGWHWSGPDVRSLPERGADEPLDDGVLAP